MILSCQHYKNLLFIIKTIGALDYIDYSYAYLCFGYAKLNQYKKSLYFSLLHFKRIADSSLFTEKGMTHLAVALVLEKLSILKKCSKYNILLKEISILTNLIPRANIFFKESMSISKEAHYLETLIPAQFEYGRYLLRSGNRKEGIQILKESLKSAKNTIKLLLRRLQKSLQNAKYK